MLEDKGRMAAMDPENAERTAATGSSVACVVPNRVSWYFDLRGPSIHVNTACSGSLSAVDMACKALWSGDASCVSFDRYSKIHSSELTRKGSCDRMQSPSGPVRLPDALDPELPLSGWPLL